MKETFKSFVELLISVALDADVMIMLERENGKDIKIRPTDTFCLRGALALYYEAVSSFKIITF